MSEFLCCQSGQIGGLLFWSFFCQAEDGIRDLVRSRGLGDVYKRQALMTSLDMNWLFSPAGLTALVVWNALVLVIDVYPVSYTHLPLPTSDLV